MTATEHPFDVDVVAQAIRVENPVGAAQTAEVAVAALSDRLATLNRYREALEDIKRYGFALESELAREALEDV